MFADPEVLVLQRYLLKLFFVQVCGTLLELMAANNSLSSDKMSRKYDILTGESLTWSDRWTVYCETWKTFHNKLCTPDTFQ